MVTIWAAWRLLLNLTHANWPYVTGLEWYKGELQTLLFVKLIFQDKGRHKNKKISLCFIGFAVKCFKNAYRLTDLSMMYFFYLCKAELRNFFSYQLVVLLPGPRHLKRDIFTARWELPLSLSVIILTAHACPKLKEWISAYISSESHHLRGFLYV